MYYVTMTDRFMSGWGLAQGKTNKYVVECETYDQAQLIEKNAKKRDEMKYINICTRRPIYPSRAFHVTWKKFEDLKGMWKEN